MADILIIDDDAGIRRLLGAALRKAGHSVRVAADGADGVAEYRARPADVVITDVYMPRQDGIETIQQLRDEFPDSRILAISGGAAQGANAPLKDAELFGANATLAKPFTMERLVRAVSGLLGK